MVVGTNLFRRKLFKSTAVRLAFRFTLVLTVSILVLSVAFVGVIHSMISAGQKSELVKSAEILEKMYKDFELMRNQPRPMFQKNQDKKDNANDNQNKGRKIFEDRNRPHFPMIPYYISFVVSDSEGKTLHTNDKLLPKLPETNGKTKRFFQKDFFDDGDLNILYYTKTFETEKRILIITTAMDMARENSSKIYKSIPKTILLAIMPILLISFFVSLFITKNTIKPVVKITKEASKISSSNLSMRLQNSKYEDEIDELINTFNKLFERLKIDFDREKQFTSDVSHELKTPVAVILGQTNLLLRWGKDDPVQLQKSLESIKKETKSMEAIISNLLQISRIENGKIKPNFEQINLNEMFSRIKEEFNAISPNVSINCIDSSNNQFLKSDSELLHQVLTIIVSNSIKYAGNDCQIKMFAKNNNEEMTISIEDNGQGFSEETLPHVFERFYRGDESHTRSVGGSGLGLSIAKTIVEALNGTISAENSETHGARLILKMQMQ